MEKIIKQRPLLTSNVLSPNPLLNRLYQARGVESPEELELSLKHLHRPNLLAHIDDAAELLVNALAEQSRIVIVGDFDTDGATSTAVMILALRMFGFKHVDYLIPDRFSQGYGLSVAVAEMVLMKEVDLVVTVDNGISSLEGIALLKEKGISVLVTDHHLPPDELPDADVLVNPNLSVCSFPSKSLAGVGVAFYVMLALRAKLREKGVLADPEPNLAELLDLVALGTVADVVALDRNNRILVHQGLNRIRAGSCRAGIKALMEVAKRNAANLQASDLGFAIAPRLNAAGRLENMSLGVELLIAENMQIARQYALELDSLNQTRKEFEENMKAEALAICRQLPLLMQQEQVHGITLYQADWHQGVLGIVASRIKDQFHRPVIAFAQEQEDSEYLKGSARSISGLHMRDLLEQIDRENPNLMTKFGGHAMAAGLTIHQDNYLQFQKIFDKTVKQVINKSLLQGVIYTDGSLNKDEMTLEIAEMLRRSGPWGQNFPEPVFEGMFKIFQQKLVAGKHLKLILESEDRVLVDAIYFNVDLKKFPDPSMKVAKCIYKLEVNEFHNNKNLQLMIETLVA